LLSGTADGHVLKWDLRKDDAKPAELFRFSGEEAETNSWYRIVLSPDGKWLAGGGLDKGLSTIVLRSFPDGKTTKRIELDHEKREFPRSLAFDPSGSRLAVGVNHVSKKAFYNQPDGQVRIYDYGREGAPTSVGKQFPCTYQVEGVAYTPDGKRLALAGGDNHEVTLFDV